MVEGRRRERLGRCSNQRYGSTPWLPASDRIPNVTADRPCASTGWLPPPPFVWFDKPVLSHAEGLTTNGPHTPDHHERALLLPFTLSHSRRACPEVLEGAAPAPFILRFPSGRTDAPTRVFPAKAGIQKVPTGNLAPPRPQPAHPEPGRRACPEVLEGAAPAPFILRFPSGRTDAPTRVFPAKAGIQKVPTGNLAPRPQPVIPAQAGISQPPARAVPDLGLDPRLRGGDG